MADWDRFQIMNRQRLLEHVVPLTVHDWYTMSNLHSYMGSRDAVPLMGYDTGNPILILPEYHEAILRIPLFTAYTAQRRALREAFCGMDFFDQPIICAAGHAFNPADRQQISNDHIGDLYDICISFHTAPEAVAFRMMVQGIHEE